MIYNSILSYCDAELSLLRLGFWRGATGATSTTTPVVCMWFSISNSSAEDSESAAAATVFKSRRLVVAGRFPSPPNHPPSIDPVFQLLFPFSMGQLIASRHLREIAAGH